MLACSACDSGSQKESGKTYSSKAQPVTYTVEIKQLKFVPEVLIVHQGDTVQWKNSDIFAHTVTSNDKTFDSGKVEVGATWSLPAPSEKGDYFYLCTLHPNMKAKLVVQ